MAATAMANRVVDSPCGRIYPALMLALTQIAYLPVASTMLSTSFFEPSQEECEELRINGTSSTAFHSLLVEWGYACQDSAFLTIVSMTVMLGASIGAFISGFLADRFGRKPVVVGTLAVLASGNALLWMTAGESALLSLPVFLVLGAAAGGYMVTNFVLLVESVRRSRSRVLMVSVNGWPMSVAGTALLAFLSRNWRAFHLVTALIAAVFALLLQAIACESVPWQETTGRSETGKNGGNGELVTPDESFDGRTPPKDYSYIDLLRLKSIRRSLIALVYCFTVSSVVSFGFYMNVEKIPGGRYLNLGLMGVGKFLLGLLPLLLSRCVGRRPIQIVSIGVACTAAWALVLSIFAGMTEDTLFSVLSLIVATSMDPSWKMQHLYSAELFPTVVRNMARGVCNVGARFGGVIAPLIVRLRSTNWVLPYIVFATLLSIQLAVSHFCLPETQSHKMRDVPVEHEKELESISSQVPPPEQRPNSERGCEAKFSSVGVSLVSSTNR